MCVLVTCVVLKCAYMCECGVCVSVSCTRVYIITRTRVCEHVSKPPHPHPPPVYPHLGMFPCCTSTLRTAGARDREGGGCSHNDTIHTRTYELIEMRDYRKLNTHDSSSLISSLLFNITHRITVTRLNILHYNIMYIHVYTYYV